MSILGQSFGSITVSCWLFTSACVHIPECIYTYTHIKSQCRKRPTLPCDSRVRSTSISFLLPRNILYVERMLEADVKAGHAVLAMEYEHSLMSISYNL